MSVDLKIKAMEREIKERISGGKITIAPKSPFPMPKKIDAKNVLPIRVDDAGLKYINCPQTDFGLDPAFCVGCKTFKGESLGRIFCDYSFVELSEEEEM